MDEFQSFATSSFIDILSEARKYRLKLILANQYLGQIDEKIREAILGNVGTLVSFRLGAEDARYLSKEFYPAFGRDNLANLPAYEIYLKLMIDGKTSEPFSGGTLGPAAQKKKPAFQTAGSFSHIPFSVQQPLHSSHNRPKMRPCD